MLNWTNKDDEDALKQGWDLFTVYGSEHVDDGTVQLQKHDEVEVFKTDPEAWVFVWTQANQGNVLARKALSFLLDHNPKEYLEIKQLVENNNG